MIKLAIKHYDYPNGGAERVTMHLARYLVPRGYRIFIFADKIFPELLSDFDRENLTFVQMPPSNEHSKEYALFMVDKINELGIDILMCPVVTPRRIDLVREHTPCKIVFSQHNQPGWDYVDYFERKRHKAERSLGAWLFWKLLKEPFERMRGRVRHNMLNRYKRDYGNSDIFTVLMPEYKEQTLEILGIPHEGNHILVTPNYVEPRDYGTPVKKKQVLYVGRLNYADKRVDRLVDIWGMVWAQHPDWELLIVGAGAEREALERQASGMGNVRFCGYCTEPWEYYRDASIVCVTSTFESWGLVLSEGMQAGCVPAAFDVSAGVHTQLEGGCGVLVPPFDLAEYAARLSQLMGDDEQRARMGGACIARARTYSSEDRLAVWDEAFRKLGVRS